MQQTKLELMQAQMTSFREKLEEFALKHRQVVLVCLCSRNVLWGTGCLLSALFIVELLSPPCVNRYSGYRACREEIRRDPIFRAQFHVMCANIGVDPLASNKGMWAQLLGFGDFYYELGVQVVEACLATRAVNGGLMELETLSKHVQVRP